MASDPNNVYKRARAYAQQNTIALKHLLGAGYDGSVFATDRKSAIKVLKWQELYSRERDVYLRLQLHEIQKIAGCHVPQLISFDDSLWIVEMTIVSAPYVLDFAGVYLDRCPEFPLEIRRQWEREKRLQFGENWRFVPRIVVAFEQLGIYLADLNPRNICLDDYEVNGPRP